MDVALATNEELLRDVVLEERVSFVAPIAVELLDCNTMGAFS